MDRRQIKSRKAILQAFCALLKQKDYGRITVQEIIDAADVGRTTFYAHFETKEFLLQTLCSDLFDHIKNYDHADSNDPKAVFLHLFNHLRRNDNNLLDLLSSPNNALFMTYFRANLKDLAAGLLQSNGGLPNDLAAAYVSAAFVETAGYWINSSLVQTEKQVNDCFFALVGHLLK